MNKLLEGGHSPAWGTAAGERGRRKRSWIGHCLGLCLAHAKKAHCCGCAHASPGQRSHAGEEEGGEADLCQQGTLLAGRRGSPRLLLHGMTLLLQDTPSLGSKEEPLNFLQRSWYERKERECSHCATFYTKLQSWGPQASLSQLPCP